MIFKLAAVLAGCMGWGAAQAAISCSFGASPGFVIPYTGSAAASSATSVGVSCTRTDDKIDPASTTYTVTFDAGLYNNRAAAVVNGTTYYLAYSKAAAAPGCSPAITTVTGTISWPTTGAPASRIGTVPSIAAYAGCVAAQPLVAAATYTDTIGLTLTHTAGPGSVPGTAPVSITMGANCTVSQAPTNMTFNYTGFQTSALVATSNFGVTCTNTTPYRLSFGTATVAMGNGTVPTGSSISSGTAAGLAYSLTLNTIGWVNGNGVEQSHTITGTMAGGQPGDCTGSCTASNTHNVIVEY
jgi:spore coat protein U-like protein